MAKNRSKRYEAAKKAVDPARKYPLAEAVKVLKGMPPAIRDRLIIAIEKAQADPAFKLAAERAFAPIRYLAPAAYEAELRSDDVRFRALWKELPWTDK